MKRRQDHAMVAAAANVADSDAGRPSRYLFTPSLEVKDSVRIHARSHAIAVRTEGIGKALPYGLGHTP
jgi:hypothetical protein